MAVELAVTDGRPPSSCPPDACRGATTTTRAFQAADPRCQRPPVSLGAGATPSAALPRSPSHVRASTAARTPPWIDAALARMFFSPWPAPDASPSNPVPSSRTMTTRLPARCSIVTSARRAPACRRAFARPSCTMRKISICSSGARRHRGVDLDLDVQHAVGGEEVDVPLQGRVERRRPRRRRERQHREARLLLGRLGGVLELGQDLVQRGAGLEHADLRGEREQVLREAVVDLPRDARALLGDGAAELGLADRAPHADEQHDEREQPQEVALEHVLAGTGRREDVVEVGEDDQREREREPAVEVAPVAAEAEPEPDRRRSGPAPPAGRTRARPRSSARPREPRPGGRARARVRPATCRRGRRW